MAIIPSSKELKAFGKRNPIRSMVLMGFIGFTLVDVLSSFTLPRGRGPLTKYPAAVNQLSGSTSTSTSTSTSHPPHIVREALVNNNLNGFGSTSTTTSVSSTHLPPGLRRRMMSRTYESEVAGAHLGKQTLSVVDRAQESAEKNFSDMYGLAGITAEMGDGWTE